MCEPVSATMAAISVIQAQQQAQAAREQASAQNAAYERNQQLQLEAYETDMGRYAEQETAISKQMFETAEEAAEARIDALINQQERTASLRMANMEATGGGQSPARQLGFLRRQLSDTLYDIDQQFQANVAQLKGQRKNLQYEKVSRRYNAISAISSIQRAPYQSSDSILGDMATAGLSGYYAGGGFKKKPNYKLQGPSISSNAGTTNTTTMSSKQ